MIETFEAAVREHLVLPLERRGFEHAYGPVDPRSRASLVAVRESRLRRAACASVEFYLHGPLVDVVEEWPHVADHVDQDEEVHLTVEYDTAAKRIRWSGGPHEGLPVATETEMAAAVAAVRRSWRGRD